MKGHVLADAEPPSEYEDGGLEPEPEMDGAASGVRLRGEMASWEEGVAGHEDLYGTGNGEEEYHEAGEVEVGVAGQDVGQLNYRWAEPARAESPFGVEYQIEEDERVAQEPDARDQLPGLNHQTGRSRFRDSEQWGDDASFSNGGVEAPAALPPPEALMQPERVGGRSAEVSVPGRAPAGKGRAAGGVLGDSPRVSGLVKNVFLGEAKRPAPQKGAKQSNEPDLAGKWQLSCLVGRVLGPLSTRF